MANPVDEDESMLQCIRNVERLLGMYAYWARTGNHEMLIAALKELIVYPAPDGVPRVPLYPLEGEEDATPTTH